MYFPYLFGRKSELLAVRATSQKYASTGTVVPIIEPVVRKSNDLVRCLEQLGKANAPAIVLMNPDQGAFKVNGVAATWRTEMKATFGKHPSLVPALKCGPKTSFKLVQSFLTAYAGRQVALVYTSPSLTDAEVANLAGLANVAHHICLQGKMTSAQRSLLPKSKAVDIHDYYNKQARNADYNGTELFTDRHKTFSSSSVGFGDYTITGSSYQEGGGKPAAVAIHAAYKHPQSSDIWIEHFVSDDVDINTGSAASKYLEAVAKLAPAAGSRVSEFGTNDALAEYLADYNAGHFPGLGKSKERQIYHHIAVMHDILNGTL